MIRVLILADDDDTVLEDFVVDRPRHTHSSEMSSEELAKCVRIDLNYGYYLEEPK